MRGFFFTAVPVQCGPFPDIFFYFKLEIRSCSVQPDYIHFFRNFLLVGKCERLFRIFASVAASAWATGLSDDHDGRPPSGRPASPPQSKRFSIDAVV